MVYDFAPGRGGDGMRLDLQGNLWIAAGINMARGAGETTDNPPGIYVITPAGKLLGRIPVPEDLITNLTFGVPIRSFSTSRPERAFTKSTSMSLDGVFSRL